MPIPGYIDSNTAVIAPRATPSIAAYAGAVYGEFLGLKIVKRAIAKPINIAGIIKA